MNAYCESNMLVYNEGSLEITSQVPLKIDFSFSFKEVTGMIFLSLKLTTFGTLWAVSLSIIGQ